MNDSILLSTLFERHCIEYSNIPDTTQPLTYAGKCGTAGTRNSGHRLHVRMSHPTGILSIDGHSEVYYASWEQSAIYMINKVNDEVTTLSDEVPQPRMMTYSVKYDFLLVGVDFGVMRVKLLGGRAVWQSGGESAGSDISDVSSLRFSYPAAVAILEEDTIIVSDQGNDR